MGRAREVISPRNWHKTVFQVWKGRMHYLFEVNEINHFHLTLLQTKLSSKLP